MLYFLFKENFVNRLLKVRASNAKPILKVAVAKASLWAGALNMFRAHPDVSICLNVVRVARNIQIAVTLILTAKMA
jgi:hypothetical protein